MEKSSDVQALLEHISQYEREFKKWTTRSERIIDKYRDEKRGNGNSGVARFNILWSNVQTLVPATFAKAPKADVSRRFRDLDPVARIAGILLERNLNHEIDCYSDFRTSVKQCVYDRFLGGRGTVWVRYEPNIEKVGIPEDGVEVTSEIEAGDEADIPELIKYERSPVDYVHWKDFGHQVARTWDEVNVVWRRVFMTRAACIERFGEKDGKRIPLDSKPDKDQQRNATENRDSLALIYEAWDKEKKKAYWLSKSLGEFIDERDDPLQLEEFFPCPKPLYATLTNETLIPVPDFTIYQDQAAELDVLADRQQGLIDALQVKGVYNAEFPMLARLFTEGENGKLFPVKDFSAFAEKNGMKGAIDLVELEPIYEALMASYKAVEEVKQQIYDITGLSDIVRGSSEAQETATAQNIKGQYASMRLNTYKTDVAQFCTDILRIKAQIIAKFQPQSLLEAADAKQLQKEDQQFLAPALELIANGSQRGFRIEVAADSLVQIDQQQERQDRSQFIAAVGSSIKDAGPIIEKAPELGPMLLKMIKFTASAYNAGKDIEGVIDTALDRMEEAIAQKAANPKPDPEMMRVQQEGQTAQGKLQIDQGKLQLEQAKSQREAQEHQLQLQADAQQRQLDMQTAAMDNHRAQLDAQREAMQSQHEQQMAAQQAAFDHWKTEIDNQTKIVIAQISAGSAAGPAGPDGKPAAPPPPDAGLDAVTEKVNASMEQLITP